MVSFVVKLITFEEENCCFGVRSFGVVFMVKGGTDLCRWVWGRIG